jgi:hypothetical protein
VRPVFDVLCDIEATMRDIHSTAAQFGVESLARVRMVAQQTLMSNAGWIAGTGYVSAVDVLADMPRWLEWWIAGPNGPEPLRVDLDPRLPDFYDYTSSEWFERPRDTGETWVAGPYVDVRGTNEYTVTAAMPIRSRDVFLGVAAADLYLSGLELRLLPMLNKLGRPVVLANDDGRVIASTDWRVLPGELLDESGKPPTTPCRHFPWRVVASDLV